MYEEHIFMQLSSMVQPIPCYYSLSKLSTHTHTREAILLLEFPSDEQFPVAR